MMSDLAKIVRLKTNEECKQQVAYYIKHELLKSFRLYGRQN